MTDSRETTKAQELARELCSFIDESPSPHHTTRSLKRRLDEASFTELKETEPYDLEPGGSYYVTRNSSSLIAFRIGTDIRKLSYKIAAAHSDSPSFRIKAVPTLEGPGPYVRLDVEPYGGIIDRTWLDRPLSVAGRVMVERGSRIDEVLIAPERDLLLIPSLAIHLQRDVNDKGAIDRTHDIFPLFKGEAGGPSFLELVAEEAGAEPSQVLSYDLVLSTREHARVWGLSEEFVSGPRLDDLQCAFAGLSALIGAGQGQGAGDGISVFCCFNNEEVGSSTLQGAQSTFFSETLERISYALGHTRASHMEALARSFVVSCDNAHALHPNHPELYDELNRVYLNGGVVFKEAARQTYATDAFSAAVFEHICREAGVPTQHFANRSDMRGGSTLGNILLRGGASIHTVDVGLAQLAMHSSFETAGSLDTYHLTRALLQLYNDTYEYKADNTILFHEHE